MEGKVAGESLEQQDPNRVPVGGGAQARFCCCLLGGHVVEGSDDAPRAVAQSGRVPAAAGGRGGRLVDLHRQSKVENLHQPFGSHSNVGGLDVAVNLAKGVQGVEANRQLRQGIAQAVLVVGGARAQ